jgi:hypothetical protein
MTDEDRAAVADLAMRALDTILADYGEEAELVAASLVFEVRVPDEDDTDDDRWHVNYKSLARNSPHHIGGLLYSTAAHILNPASDE